MATGKLAIAARRVPPAVTRKVMFAAGGFASATGVRSGLRCLRQWGHAEVLHKEGQGSALLGPLVPLLDRLDVCRLRVEPSQLPCLLGGDAPRIDVAPRDPPRLVPNQLRRLRRLQPLPA
jgi:hypothetical protein